LLGMALLIFANDFVTMSLATDNVKYTSDPNKWNIRTITFASLIIGAMVLGGGTIALFLGTRYFHLQSGQLQTFMLLILVFTSQFNVYIVRERKFFWSSRPGRELMFSTAGGLVVFSLLGVFGLIMTPIAPQQVLLALGFSALFTFAIDYPKYLAFKKFAL
jgi:H+-transporting ATPase